MPKLDIGSNSCFCFRYLYNQTLEGSLSAVLKPRELAAPAHGAALTCPFSAVSTRSTVNVHSSMRLVCSCMSRSEIKQKYPFFFFFFWNSPFFFAPHQDGRFWKRSETEKRKILFMVCKCRNNMFPSLFHPYVSQSRWRLVFFDTRENIQVAIQLF